MDMKSTLQIRSMISCTKRFVSQPPINGSGTDRDWSAQKVRDSRRLASMANTPERAEAAEEANGNVEGMDDELDESDGAEETSEKSVRAPQTLTKSQYELTREANIAKNKELLQKLEVEYSAAKIEKKPTKRASKRETTKNESGEKQEATRFSARIQGPR